MSLDLDVPSLGENSSTDLEQVIRAIAKKKSLSSSTGPTTRARPESAVAAVDAPADGDQQGAANLPKTIRFPYSRHSSYPELCAFVDAFKPRDVWPCTVNPDEWIRNGTSIESLFGPFCSGNTFEYDKVLGARRPIAIDLLSDKGSQQAYETQRTTGSSPTFASSLVPETTVDLTESRKYIPTAWDDIRPPAPFSQFVGPLPNTQMPIAEQPLISGHKAQDQEARTPRNDNSPSTSGSRKRCFDECADSEAERNLDQDHGEDEPEQESQETEKSFVSDISHRDSTFRRDAYTRMREFARGNEWAGILLLSTDAGHTKLEKELGSRDQHSGRRDPTMH